MEQRMKRDYTFEVNGFEVTASYEDEVVEEIFIPLLKKWDQMQKEEGRRIMVFVSAPPGAGKSTVCQFLEYLGKREQICDLQTVGLDGFHYHQDYILEHTVCVNGVDVPMKSVKGCPESYDVEWLGKKLALLQQGDVKFPIYSRLIHDVVEEAVDVTKQIILIEGNWLLSSEEPWTELERYCDDSLFIYAGEELLKDRLIGRKVKGGTSLPEAEAHYERCDRKNVQRILAHHRKARLNLQILSDSSYRVVEEWN